MKPKLTTIPILYTYQLKTGKLNQYTHVQMNNVSNNVSFAVNEQLYLQCDSKPYHIFENKELDMINFWMDDFDHCKAIELISTYILENIPYEIRTSNVFWNLVDKMYREAHTIDELVPNV